MQIAQEALIACVIHEGDEVVEKTVHIQQADRFPMVAQLQQVSASNSSSSVP